jgi:hypothetical protein
MLGSASVSSGTFMARSARGESGKLKVTSTDSDEAITKQWSQFRDFVARRDAVLLFHLTNHYALIYGVR